MEETMRIWSLSLISALSLAIVPALFVTASAQEEPQPDFVPGELIVGYKSPEARASAVRELGQLEAQGGIRRGDAASTEIEVEPIDDTTVRLKFNFVHHRGGPLTEAGKRKALEETAELLREADETIEYAHPNWIMRLQRDRIREPVLFKQEPDETLMQAATAPSGPNDPVFVRGLHWHYLPPPHGMNAIGAWDLATEGTDVVVAVLDTGILPDHPDITESGNVVAGYDFVSPHVQPRDMAGDGDGWDNDPTDPGNQCGIWRPANWHGTHVAGTVGAGATNNEIGIAGVTWKVSVLPVRVLGRCGGTIADIAAAIRWAAGLPVEGAPDNPSPADIINMSLGIGLACKPENVGALISAIEAARNAGVAVVVAAGNDDIDVEGVSPGGCANVISVAASDQRGHLAPYSNYGAVTIMAPGGDLERDDDEDGEPDGVWSLLAPSTRSPEGIGAYEGTSMATPHVAAAIALAIAARPELKRNPDAIAQAVEAAAVSPPEGGCSQQKPCGTGQLDAVKLLSP
jgi:serine protease